MDPQTPQPPVAPQPMPQPAQPMAAAGPYASNPFRPLLDVLGKSLTVNGMAALQLGFMAMLLGILAYVLGILLVGLIAGLSHSVVLGVVLSIVLFLGLMYFILTVGAAFIKLIEDSTQGVGGGWKGYLSAGRPFALRLLGLGILMELGIAAAMILLIIPGFYVMGRWMLAPFAMVRENLGVTAALGRSWKLTKGHVWETLGSLMAGALLGSNGLLSVLVLPAGLAGRYEQLKALEAGQVSKPKLHYMNWLLVIVFPLLFAGLFALSFLSAMQNVQNKNSQQQTIDQLYQQELQNSQSQDNSQLQDNSLQSQ